MYDLLYRWSIDSFSYKVDDWYNKFGYVPTLFKSRSTADLVSELSDCMSSCLELCDDSNYLKLLFKDYESYFGTSVYISDINKKAEICTIIHESERVNHDYLSLYYKGVSLKTLDLISDDIVGNNANLSDSIIGG